MKTSTKLASLAALDRCDLALPAAAADMSAAQAKVPAVRQYEQVCR